MICCWTRATGNGRPASKTFCGPTPSSGIVLRFHFFALEGPGCTAGRCVVLDSKYAQATLQEDMLLEWCAGRERSLCQCQLA